MEPDQVNDVATDLSYGCVDLILADPGSLFQSFTPSNSSLAAVDILFRVEGVFPEEGCKTVIKIRSGTPDGNVVATLTAFVPGSSPAGDQMAVRFYAAAELQLSPGDSYVIEWS